MNLNSGISILLPILVFYPIIGAIVSYVIGRFNKTARDYFADFIVVSELAAVIYMFVAYGIGANVLGENGSVGGVSVDTLGGIFFGNVPEICGFGLHFVLNGFRSVYTLVAAIMWAMTTIFSKEYFAHYHNRNRYYMFMLLTFGATMGVFLSADLYTTFIFFEMMSFTSYVWVAHDEKKASMRAAETYLAVAVIGGMVMLMGLFMIYNTLGTLEIASLLDAGKSAIADGKINLLYAAGACITVGFGAKAGAFPLHIWLPKAHPVAPAPASALLSGILTKSGIYGMLVVSCNLLYADGNWASVILLLGTLTMFGGALLAVFSIDLKRTLACSSMSQIGFIMIGIGMQGLLGAENALAARGTVLHMVNHSLIKLDLFMVAGVIYMNLHKLDLNDIRGFGRKKPLLNFIFLMGALGIGGIPLWNGYVSKTLLHEAIVEYTELVEEGVAGGFYSVAGLKTIEWIFLISGGMTVAYMTKLYIAIFIEKNADPEVQKKYDDKKKYMNTQSLVALTISAVLMPIMGFFPNVVMDFLADRGTDLMNGAELEHAIHYFSLGNLKGAAVSIVIGAVLYLGVIRTVLMRKVKNDGVKDGVKEDIKEEVKEEVKEDIKDDIKEDIKVYVNLWPAWWDLENGIYRPLITMLCAIGGFFSRICDSLVDSIVVLLRKTVYRDCELQYEMLEGNLFTMWLGRRMNKKAKEQAVLTGDESLANKDYVHELAMRGVAIKEEFFIVTRTLSFGMIICTFGLVVTMIYLLCVHW